MVNRAGIVLGTDLGSCDTWGEVLPMAVEIIKRRFTADDYERMGQTGMVRSAHANVISPGGR